MLGHIEKPRLVDHGRNKLQYQLALIAAIVGIALAFIAVRFNEKVYLNSKSSGRRATAPYTRMWFDNNTLIGARIGHAGGSAKLTLERWSSARPVEVTLGGLAETGESANLWAVSTDGTRVVWADHQTLRWADAGPGSATGYGAALLPARKELLSVGVLSGGSMVAAYSDGSVDRWEADGRATPSWQSPLKDVDQSAINGDYLALGSGKQQRSVLYHFRDPQGWSKVEDTPVLDPPYRLLVPAPGVMAQIGAEGFRVSGKTRNSPGSVRFAGSHQEDVIAAGDFDGIVVLPPDDDAYSIAPAQPGSMLAAGESQFAVSGPRETDLFELGIETRLTKAGRRISYVAMGLLILAAILALNKFLRAVMFDLLNTLLKRKPAGVPAPPALPSPPGPLVDVCAREEAVLWAGAGLSAQSGLPVRAAFVRTLLQEASVESWMEGGIIRKLISVAARDHESALDQLVAMSNTGAMRNQLTTYFRSVLSRYARPSRSHELLSNIPFAAGVTTNYDHLLRDMGHRWKNDPITLADVRQEAVAGAPFLLQIYGDPEGTNTTVFSRAQMHAMLAKAPGAETLRGLFIHNNLLFVGCSLEGLVADLKVLGLPDKPARRHFAVAGASGPDWQKRVTELQNRYGIQVLACQEENISRELPEFLFKLSKAVDRARGIMRTEAPPAPVAMRARAL